MVIILTNKFLGCLHRLGYLKMNYIQKEAFQTITRKGRSTIVIAPTGMGKTEAAVFPVMYMIAKNKIDPIAAIYISPLRALNRDLEKRLYKLGKCFGVRVALRHGDTPSSVRRKLLENPPHLLITTPETLGYLLINEKLKPWLENLGYVIIDEYRELIEGKRGLLLFTLIHLLESILGRRIIKIALTATLSNTEEAAKLLNDPGGVEIIKDPSGKAKRIEVVLPECMSKICRRLVEEGMDPEHAARLLYILARVKEERGVLIFTNTRSLAEKLGALLNTVAEKLGEDVSIAVHHGSLSRGHRIEVEEGFRAGKVHGLIATSSMELGIDIGNISYVIQYLSPRQAVRLEQRIGRSGHRLGGLSRGSIVVDSNPLQILESIILAYRSSKGDLEKEIIIDKPLDVLAYATTIYTLMAKEANIWELYNSLIKHPLFSSLEFEEYRSLIDYLCYTGIVRCRENKLFPSRRSKLYIYLHTMIPDTRDIPVIDVSSRRKIGSLTEEYVVLNINPNDILVLAGRPWRVVEYDNVEAKLYVEQPKLSHEGLVIPHWEGENIPVEYETAQLVAESIKEGVPPKIDNVKVGVNAVDRIGKANKLLKIVDRKRITIVYNRKYKIIYVISPHGSRVNRLIRDMLKYILATRYPGFKIYVYSTPYSIIILEENKLLDSQTAHYLKSVIQNMSAYMNHETLKLVARASGTLHWRIYQVAQRFGAINVKDRTRITKHMLDSFSDTVIGMEALKEVLIKDYDIIHARELAERIVNGTIEVIEEEEDNDGLLKILIGYTEKPLPPVIRTLDDDRYLEKIKSRKITLICIRCGHRITKTVREIMELKEYRCPRCGYVSLAPVKGDGEEEYRIIRKHINGERLTDREKKVLSDLRRRALLLLNFGSIVPLILAATGVGTGEAIRIINAVRRGSPLVDELYKSEIKYMKIKKYIKKS